MKRLLTLAVMAGLLMTMALGGIAQAKKDQPRNVKVWVCHFPGHDLEPDVTLGSGTVIEGDYILNNVDGTPTAGQQELCEVTLGGKLINPSSRGAVNGHKAQFPERISEY